MTGFGFSDRPEMTFVKVASPRGFEPLTCRFIPATAFTASKRTVWGLDYLLTLGANAGRSRPSSLYTCLMEAWLGIAIGLTR